MYVFSNGFLIENCFIIVLIMIKSKEDYYYYLEEDAKRYPFKIKITIWSRLFSKEYFYVWRFIKNLRKTEYLMNTRTTFLGKIQLFIQRIWFYHLMHQTGIQIHPNVCGPGLYIPHIGRVLIPTYAKIGKNCTIRPDLLIATNLGVSNRKTHTIEIGDDVEFSEGVKILCKRIGNNVTLGPNSVVLRNVPDNTSVLSYPAEFIPKDIS